MFCLISSVAQSPAWSVEGQSNSNSFQAVTSYFVGLGRIDLKTARHVQSIVDIQPTPGQHSIQWPKTTYWSKNELSKTSRL